MRKILLSIIAAVLFTSSVFAEAADSPVRNKVYYGPEERALTKTYNADGKEVEGVSDSIIVVPYEKALEANEVFGKRTVGMAEQLKDVKTQSGLTYGQNDTVILLHDFVENNQDLSAFLNKEEIPFEILDPEKHVPVEVFYLSASGEVKDIWDAGGYSNITVHVDTVSEGDQVLIFQKTEERWIILESSSRDKGININTDSSGAVFVWRE